MGDLPADALGYRLAALERRISRVEDLEPAVMRQEIRDVKEDIQQISRDVSTVKRMFMGFVISFSVASVTLVVLIFSVLRSGGKA